MKSSVLVAIGSLAFAASSFAQDAIDLSHAIIHNSPADVASWPIAANVSRVNFGAADPSAGVDLESSAFARWPDYIPPGWSGPIEYTVWACANVEGGWHCAGFIQMWRGRTWTGAALPNEWNQNWAYDAARWGALADYVPHAGDVMGFFATAGNARGDAGVTSVRGRTNVVAVRLPASGGSASYDCPAACGASIPAPTAPTVVPPVSPPPVIVSPLDLSSVVARLDLITSTQMQQLAVERDTNGQVHELNSSVGQTFKDITTFAAKYIAPAVAAWLAAKKF